LHLKRIHGAQAGRAELETALPSLSGKKSKEGGAYVYKPGKLFLPAFRLSSLIISLDIFHFIKGDQINEQGITQFYPIK
jgi:hypothetical protein